jgi:hypothetical protein
VPQAITLYESRQFDDLMRFIRDPARFPQSFAGSNQKASFDSALVTGPAFEKAAVSREHRATLAVMERQIPSLKLGAAAQILTWQGNYGALVDRSSPSDSRLSQAGERWLQAIYYDPLQVDAWSGLGLVMIYKGLYDDAASALQKAAVLAQGSSVALPLMLLRQNLQRNPEGTRTSVNRRLGAE